MMLLLLLHYCYCFSLLSHTRNPGFYGLVDRTTIQRPRELTARTALALRGYTFNSSQPLSLSLSHRHTQTRTAINTEEGYEKDGGAAFFNR
uniref:Putative secreted peptide n=1 Tax=Anopheles braziliensis TaxID=58242 RepID=A0A2M3ZP23_9DIPT